MVEVEVTTFTISCHVRLLRAFLLNTQSVTVKEF